MEIGLWRKDHFKLQTLHRNKRIDSLKKSLSESMSRINQDGGKSRIFLQEKFSNFH